MNRIIPLVIVGFVTVALAIGAIGFTAVRYWTRSRPAEPPALSYRDLEDLQAEPDKAAAEIPRIIACFEVEDENLRMQAAETLKSLGKKGVDPLREKLKDRNPKVRFCAVQTLALLGPDAASASEDILECLKDDQPDVRYKAVYALGKLGVKSNAVIEALVKALGDKDAAVTETAVETLGNIGPPSKESLPRLAELAGKDSAPAVRTVAIKLLGQMGAVSVPTFQDLLKKADTLDKITLIQAIATLGADAAPLLPEMQTIMLKSRFWDDHEASVGIFKKCGGDGASGLVTVLKTLHDPKSPHFAPDDERSVTLLKAIGEMGATAKLAVPVLIDILKGSDSLRMRVLETLGDIGPSAQEAIPVVELLTNEPATANAARGALRRMGKIVKK